MPIEEYRFGKIVIDGRSYTHDVEVRWNEIPSDQLEVLEWQRKESHLIDVEDVKGAVEKSPETIIIGTGESGVAGVTEEAQDFIESKGIQLIVDRTGEAVRTFNVINQESEEEEGARAKVIGLFHLTC